jgi:hypothetical protein
MAAAKQDTGEKSAVFGALQDNLSGSLPNECKKLPDPSDLIITK